MNALWAGGAEAMAVQGHRVVSTTGVRCVGNVLHIQGRIYSPPFRVEAIGDPEQLRTSLIASEGVQIYLQYVDAVGLGWSVEETGLELPAYSGSLSLRHAEPGGNEEPGGDRVDEVLSASGLNRAAEPEEGECDDCHQRE